MFRAASNKTSLKALHWRDQQPGVVNVSSASVLAVLTAERRREEIRETASLPFQNGNTTTIGLIQRGAIEECKLPEALSPMQMAHILDGRTRNTPAQEAVIRDILKELPAPSPGATYEKYGFKFSSSGRYWFQDTVTGTVMSADTGTVFMGKLELTQVEIPRGVTEVGNLHDANREGAPIIKLQGKMFL